jgi:hypothetical protein
MVMGNCACVRGRPFKGETANRLEGGLAVVVAKVVVKILIC